MFDWDRFAVVTDSEWISRTTKFMAMLMPMGAAFIRWLKRQKRVNGSVKKRDGLGVIP